MRRKIICKSDVKLLGGVIWLLFFLFLILLVFVLGLRVVFFLSENKNEVLIGVFVVVVIFVIYKLNKVFFLKREKEK